jgi:hypothetical protein
MKKLVFTNHKALKKHEETVNQLVNSLNLVLDRFKKEFNYFGQPVNESFAFELVTDPAGTFDRLLRANSPIKPIGNKQLDIEKLAELTGIDRDGFINAFTIVLPGSIDSYNRAGTVALFRLSAANKLLVKWQDEKFALNQEVLNMELERFKVYAESPEQIELLNSYERLCDTLNDHAKTIKLDAIDSNLIAQRLGIDFKGGLLKGGLFAPFYDKLAKQIKSMELVN